MHRNAKRAVALLLIVVAGLCACSRQSTLARRIAKADRVIATNRYGGFSISITGEEARRVIQAVSAAKKENPLIEASPDLRIEFFQGTNLLGAVGMCRSVIGIDGTSYSDRTGVLEALDDKYRQERLNPTPHDR
jgi:hypothetical protein